MKIVIVYDRYYDFNNNNIYIGGIENYISNLIKIFAEFKLDIHILQYSDKKFIEKELQDNIKVYGVPVKKTKQLVRFANSLKDSESDILLFASSAWCMKSEFSKVLAIQHGIYWDMNTIHGVKKIPENISLILRCIEALREIKRINYCKKIVCVDYNYINWYRTQTVKRSIPYVVIPNFVEQIEESEIKNNNELSIVFARRFENTRGINLLMNVVPKILDKYPSVSFTIAGNGSREKELKECLKKYNQVKFTSYIASDSVKFHKKFDIALVPSVGSEGTSLSLLEAMEAGCAVIGSDVGGITNIMLDGYNGLIIQPNEKELYCAIERLITEPLLRNKLGNNARITVNSAFSYDKWKQAWVKLIRELINEK